ncbi:MAG: hypothetical protein WAK78_08855 [Candidatus Acidiferrales bacterium]
MRKTCSGIGVALLCMLLARCGGGSGGGPVVPPTPAFTVSLSPASVTLSQGGASQAVQVSVTAQNGFTGSVSITTGTLPDGVTVSPASLSVTSDTPEAFSFSASSNAQIVQQTLSLTAVSGMLTVNKSLQLNVTGALVLDPFHAIGGTLVHGFYDESRQLLFATNPGLNELDVISGEDFSIQQRIPVPQPWGIDQMADGKTLVLGTAAQELLTVDEDTFSVTQHPFTAIGNSAFALFFPNVVAMANGKVLVIGQIQGADSDDIYEAGQYLFVWDSNTNAFSQLEPNPPSGFSDWETDSLARSADHKWAVFSADQFYLYSSDSDSLTTAPLTTVNPPQGEYGVRGYAINTDGTTIAVASADQVTFLTRSLTAIASTPIPSAFQSARTAVQFSYDGLKLYLQYPFPLNVQVVDATSYTVLGYLSGFMDPDDDNLERLLTTDSKGHAYAGIDGGLRLVNLMQTPVPNSASGNLSVPNCPTLNSALPTGSAEQITLTFPLNGSSVYVGGQSAPLLDGGTVISIPASSTSGPADVECVDIYGNTIVSPDGVSYGIDPLALSANLLPPTGNPDTYLFGFGFSASQEDTPSVTIGGRPAVKVTSLGDIGPGALQAATVQVPAGIPGETANLVVSSSLGSATLPEAATYYSSDTIVPASGLLQLLYDSHRNLVYALKASEVDVLDPTTSQWQAPLVFPATAMGTYDTMELSPDGSKLVVAGFAGQAPQLIVLDPDGSSSPSVETYTGVNYSMTGSIAITEFNKVILAGMDAVEFDLSTLSFTALNVNTGQVIRSSADGAHLYGADLNESSGEVYSIDPSTYTVRNESFGEVFWTDLAVSADGSQFAAVDAPPYATGDIAGFFDPALQYLNINQYPAFSPPDDTGVLGATFSPGGKALVVPLGDSIEIWDTVKGTLTARIMTPEELHVLVYPEGAVAPVLTLDRTGQTIYAISASGLTVLKLPEPLDQLPPAQWAPFSRRVSSNRSGLYRSLASRMAAMRGKLQK